jgi:hypothetical protein
MLFSEHEDVCVCVCVCVCVYYTITCLKDFEWSNRHSLINITYKTEEDLYTVSLSSH